MAVNLTQKERELLSVVFSELDDMPTVDFEKVAAKTGYKYGKNARTVFKKVWDRLKAGSTAGTAAVEAGMTNGAPAGSAEGEGAVNESGDKPKAKPKTTPKKAVKKETTPRKAASGGPKAPRSRKKSIKSEEAIPTEVISDNDPSKFGAAKLKYGKDGPMAVEAEEYRSHLSGENMDMGDYADAV